MMRKRESEFKSVSLSKKGVRLKSVFYFSWKVVELTL